VTVSTSQWAQGSAAQQQRRRRWRREQRATSRSRKRVCGRSKTSEGSGERPEAHQLLLEKAAGRTLGGCSVVAPRLSSTPVIGRGRRRPQWSGQHAGNPKITPRASWASLCSETCWGTMHRRPQDTAAQTAQSLPMVWSIPSLPSPLQERPRRRARRCGRSSSETLVRCRGNCAGVLAIGPDWGEGG
jgi:hypothetical protein